MVLQIVRFARRIVSQAKAALLPLSLLAMLGAAETAAGQTEIPPPQPYATLDPRGVDLVTGAFSYALPKLQIGTPGQGGLDYVRTYEGLGDAGDLVTVWRDNWFGAVVGQAIIGKRDLDPRFRMVTVMGQTIVFRRTSPAAIAFVPAQGDNANLVLSGDIYTATLADGTQATFDKTLATRYPYVADEGLITRITRPNGEIITFHYEAANPPPANLILPPRRLMSVTNNHGYQVKYEYAANATTDINAWMRVSRVTLLNNAVDSCAPLAYSCAFSTAWPALSFTQAGSQTTVTDALQRVTKIIQQSNGVRVQKPSRPNVDYIVAIGASVGSGETQAFRVAQVQMGGASWGYSYGPRPAVEPNASAYDYTVTVTDPLQHANVLTFRSYPNLGLRVARLKQRADALNHTNVYDYYTDTFRFQSLIRPESDGEAYGYDSRGNITSLTKTPKPNMGLSAVQMTATYPAACTSATANDETNIRVCNKPKTVTDYQSSTTDLTYYPAHGGVDTVTLPAPKSGAARPQTRSTYSGLYAYYYRNGGSTVAVGDGPIYLSTKTSQCRTGSSCAGAMNELVAETDYSRSTSQQLTNLQPDATRRRAGDGSYLQTTSYEYTPAGDVSNVTDPLGRQSHNEFDAMRQKLGAVSPDPDAGGPLLPRAQLIGYDADGLVTSIKSGTVSTWNASPTGLSELKDEQTHYDFLGRKDQSRLVVGGAIQTLTEYSYDGANRLVCTATRMNKAAFSTTPVDACSDRTAGADGRDRITKNDYDEADRLTVVTSGYAAPGISGGDPIADRTIAYTNNDKVLSETDGENNRTLYEYDGFDRLKKATYPSTARGTLAQNSADYDAYDYDANDNRTYWRRRESQSATERAITTVFDKLNRPMTKTVAASADIAGTNYAYDYDNFGDLTSAAEGGRTVESGYDVHKRLKTETLKLGAATVWSIGYDYDAANRRTQLTWPDGFFVTNVYDDTNALTFIRRVGSTANADKIAELSYDNLGRRAGLLRGNGVNTAYGYDPSFLLLGSLAHSIPSGSDNVTYSFAYNVAEQVKRQTISNSTYAWNEAANLDRTYVPNGLNQLTAAGAASLTYDGRGNLQSDSAATWKYDLENRLRGATAGASLVYDPLGRLYETNAVSGATTRFLYDGPNLIGEYDASMTLVRRYVHGLEPDEPLARYAGAATSAEWLLADHQGSIVAITNASGVLVNKNTYDEYGAPASGNSGLFQYTGQIYLSNLKLYHYKARAYSPALGRFLQTDPTGYDDGLNWYAYVGNDPLNGADPTGQYDLRDLFLARTEVGADGTKSFHSADLLRAFVPGQVAWDNAVTAGLNGDRVGAVVNTAAGVGEQVLTVLSAGMSRGASAVASAGAGAARTEMASGVDDLVEAAGGTARSSGDVVVGGGRNRAKELFRQFDTSGPGGRTVIRDKTGGGRGLVGKMEDGTPMRIRMKPDGTTRIQAGQKKLIFPNKQ